MAEKFVTNVFVNSQELATVKGWTKRFGELCRRIEIEAVLAKYGILDEDYRNLTLQPASLICKLYEDFGCKAEIVSGRVVGIPSKFIYILLSTTFAGRNFCEVGITRIF